METEKTFVMIPGLEESEPVSLTPLQQSIQPHTLEIQAFWWAIWGITLVYVVTRYVIIPFFNQITRK